jgi:hypothetical protein
MSVCTTATPRSAYIQVLESSIETCIQVLESSIETGASVLRTFCNKSPPTRLEKRKEPNQLTSKGKDSSNLE